MHGRLVCGICGCQGITKQRYDAFSVAESGRIAINGHIFLEGLPYIVLPRHNEQPVLYQKAPLPTPPIISDLPQEDYFKIFFRVFSALRRNNECIIGRECAIMDSDARCVFHENYFWHRNTAPICQNGQDPLQILEQLPSVDGVKTKELFGIFCIFKCWLKDY